MERRESLPLKHSITLSSQCPTWRIQDGKSSKWQHEGMNYDVSRSDAVFHIFVCIIYSFNEAQRFMSCCTGLNLVPDSQQCENTNIKPNQTDDIKCQQEEISDTEASETIWYTALETQSSCKDTDTQQPQHQPQQQPEQQAQQPGGGAQAQSHSALFPTQDKISKWMSIFQKRF